jgi:hypothetical protein
VTTAPAHQALKRIFAVLLAEAESNPGLARRLAAAIGEPRAAPASAPRRQASPAAPPVHAVNILRQHGEAALRGRLEQIKAVAELKAVAAASGLVLAGSALKARPGRGELIAAIVAAAKHYDAQRNAASA